MIETASFEEILQIRMSREIGGKPVYWVAAYLVDGLLIDTGCSYTSAELAVFLAGRPVHRIVNTHFHEDHIGGNHSLQEKFGVKISAPADSVPLIGREAKLFPYQQTVWGYPLPTETTPLPAIIRTERYLFDVIDTPGHSVGHAALVEKSRGWCFSGDIFAREKMKFIRQEEDMGKTVASMRRLIDLPTHRLILFTSVGRIVEDGRRALMECIQYIEDLSRRVKALEKKGRTGDWPVHGWIGLILIALFWILNWFLPGARTHWGFFPLWLGYSLFVDALVFRGKGHSLLTRKPGVWAGLFLVSAPAWWLFEGINLRTQNWIYLGKESFSTLEYATFSTLSFSTVMPAVFGTAEWVGTWEWVRRIGPGPVIRKTPATLRGLSAAGGLMLLLLLAWPEIFFPLVWGSVFCIIEPLNARQGNRSLLDDLSRGDWRPVIALSVGCLICGFFWEMWNFYSWPKWAYRIPYADVFHLFEMPLAGYLGYIPFSFELFALYHLVTGLLCRDKARSDLLL